MAGHTAWTVSATAEAVSEFQRLKEHERNAIAEAVKFIFGAAQEGEPLPAVPLQLQLLPRVPKEVLKALPPQVRKAQNAVGPIFYAHTVSENLILVLSVDWDRRAMTFIACARIGAFDQ